MNIARAIPRVWRILPLACLVLIVSTTPLRAAELPSDAEIKADLQRFIERDHWGVGIVVGIVDEHGTRLVSYGRMDNGDSPEVNGDTLFEIGSVTKTFTTLLLEDMIQRGEMKLDDPAEKFLPASVFRFGRGTVGRTNILFGPNAQRNFNVRIKK